MLGLGLRGPPGPGRDSEAEPLGGASLPLERRTPSALRRDALHRWMLACADVVAAAFALLVSTVVLGDDTLAPSALLTLPFVVLVCKIVGLYDRDEYLLRRTTLEEASSLFRVATLFALLIGFGERVFIMGHLGRDQVIALWVLMLASMVVARGAGRRISRALGPVERCLVLGAAADAAQVRRCFTSTDLVRASIVGRVPLEPEGMPAGGMPAQGEAAGGGAVPMLGADAGRLAALLREYRIDRVVIAPGHSDTDAILDAIGTVKSMGADVSLLPRLLEVVGSSVEFDEIDGLVLLGVRGSGLSRSSRLLKRSVDVLGSLTLLGLLAPVMAGIALALRLEGRGPVLLRTPCLGYRGARFARLDFRRPGDGAGAVGAWSLRGGSLHALPRLINVLRGEMSLVGPRPREILQGSPAENVDGGLELVPGLTGPWRAFGAADLTPGETVKADYGYGANWSLWLDGRIVLRTLRLLVRRGLTGGGAHRGGVELGSG